MTDHVARAALERATNDDDTLVVVYQPIHDAVTHEVYAVEALLRQRRDSGELREAAVIMQAAEDGSPAELYRFDHMLVHKTYTDAAKWQSGAAPNVRLNMNLSPREFQEGNVLPRLTKLVTSCGIDTHKLNLEITETSYISDPEETVHVLDSLKKLGISLWLDDFGTGHSSIEHLQHFPVDGIKIPGAFVAGVEKDARCRAITTALIRLAHELDLKVIAEEIETEAQLKFLRDLDCDYIQGFLFSRPMEIVDLETFLAAS